MTTQPPGPQQPHGSDPYAQNPPQGPAGHTPMAPAPQAAPPTQPWFGPQGQASAPEHDGPLVGSASDAPWEAPLDGVPPQMLASAAEWEAPQGLASASTPEPSAPLATGIPQSLLDAPDEPVDEASVKTHLGPAPTSQPSPYAPLASMPSAAEYAAPTGLSSANAPQDWPTSAPSAPVFTPGALGEAPTSLSSASQPDHTTQPIGAIPGWQPPAPASALTQPVAPVAGPPAGTWDASAPTGGPVFAPPPPHKPKKSMLGALAIPLALGLGVLGFAGGWFAKPSTSAPAPTVTITATPTPAGGATPLPPPPSGLAKPVGSINLANAVGELAKQKANSNGDLVQAAVYVKQGGPIQSARVVNVLRNASVATMSASGNTVKDYANFRCWKEFGLQLCGADVDGGAIITTAPEGYTTQSDTSAFFAAVLKTA